MLNQILSNSTMKEFKKRKLKEEVRGKKERRATSDHMKRKREKGNGRSRDRREDQKNQ